ncbi:MAG: protein kinase [Verrucomicrobiaceae bacterium]|nr:protein kinase [Verrucomicrobiaceae bacterium]
MIPDDQPTVPTPPPGPSRSSRPGVWVAPTVEELQAKLPQYEVLEILGRGGMGAVYKARQKSLKRLVAIKILPLGLADDEFKFAERFQNEAQTMAAMNHPAIVAVHDFGAVDVGRALAPASAAAGASRRAEDSPPHQELLYFVMEFVDGTDVHKMIQASGRLSGEYALSITAHVCDALSYAHKRGVIHRDIKPANILIDQEGHIKVADFGLAKMHDPAQTSGLTRTNMTMGTPDYVAPEVLNTGMVADHRADIYAVGVMLYQMLTGEVPRGMFKLPSDKGVGSDPRFDAIICKAMEQDREDRYQTALEVRRDLDVILTTPQPKNDGTGVVPAKELPQRPVARPPGEANTPAQNQPPAKGTAKQAPSKKPSPAVMWMSIVGIIAVLGAAAFFVFGGKTKPQPDNASAAKVGATVAPSVAGQIETGASQPGGPVIDWINALPPEGAPYNDDWGLKDGVLTPKSKVGRQFGIMENGSVRVRLRLTPDYPLTDAFGPMLQFDIRHGAVTGMENTTGQFQFQVLVPNRDCKLLYQQRVGKGPNSSPLNLWDHDSKKLKETGNVEVDWEFRANGDEFSAWVDGKMIHTARLDKVPSGYCTMTFLPGMQVTRLESTGVIPTRPGPGKERVEAGSRPSNSTAVLKSSSALPAILRWKDVTDDVRKKAREKPDLVVDSNAVDVKSDSPAVTMPLDRGAAASVAVRLTHTGDGQVTWHGGENGMIYVLCQRTKTIFHRLPKDASAPTPIEPDVPHPEGFVHTAPHQLVMTQEGSRIAAWLDGRFIGEVRDEAFARSIPQLYISKYGDVRKVEIAELTASSASAHVPPSSTARTFNGHRYEFVSGNFTWPEAKAQAEQRGGHLAVITSAEEHAWAWKTFSEQLPPQPKDKVWTRGWWLGASQTAFEKPWQWVTREPLEFTLWGRKEPSAAINPPRYLWMADANNAEGTSSWSVQNDRFVRGGFLIEWDNAGVP